MNTCLNSLIECCFIVIPTAVGAWNPIICTKNSRYIHSFYCLKFCSLSEFDFAIWEQWLRFFAKSSCRIYIVFSCWNFVRYPNSLFESGSSGFDFRFRIVSDSFFRIRFSVEFVEDVNSVFSDSSFRLRRRRRRIPSLNPSLFPSYPSSSIGRQTPKLAYCMVLYMFCYTFICSRYK